MIAAMANRAAAVVKGPNPARLILMATGLAPKMAQSVTTTATVAGGKWSWLVAAVGMSVHLESVNRCL
ncbi:hypothetical protein JCM12296A_49750 [Desulfosarcina cetonica]